MKSIILGLFLFSTGAMTGLIWMVQVVHYPLFQYVGRDMFTAYEQLHKSSITLIVAPLMLIELITSVLLFSMDSPFNKTFLWMNLLLLGIIWFSTAAIQVPLHGQLSQSYSVAAIQKLVQSNWIRTVAWSIRSVWAFWLIAKTLERT
jgi:hypothetical protein